MFKIFKNKKASFLSSSALDNTFNLWIFGYLVMVIVAFFFWNEFGLSASGSYLFLGFSTLFLIVFGFILFRDVDFIKNTIPFNRSFDRGTLSYVLGAIFVLIIFSLLWFVGSIGITSGNLYDPLVSAPLAATPEKELVSFAALKLQASPFVNWFTITKGASILEEIITGWGFILVGYLVTALLILIVISLFFTKKNSFTLVNKVRTYKNTLFIGAVMGSVLFFMSIHLLNGTYTGNPKLFIWAGMFRLLMNVMIYKFTALGLSFSIAAHEINNTLSYIFNKTTGIGIDGYLNSILNAPALLIITLTWIIPVILVVSRWQQMKSYLRDIFLLRGNLNA